MIDLIRPRWWVAAAIAAFALGIVGLYAGLPSWSPMAILAGEIFAILAAITITSPSLSVSLARQRAAVPSRQDDSPVEQPAEPPRDPAAPPEADQTH